MLVATWVGAIATFLAVVVALFKEDIVGVWRKPTLAPSISLEAPDCARTELTPDSYNLRAQGLLPIACYYFRVWVKNTGNRRAQNVQVYAAKLFAKDTDGKFREMKSFLPMNLVWSHSQPSRPEIFTDISPSMGRHCDFGRIADPVKRTYVGDDLPNLEPNDTVFRLELEAPPNSRSHLLARGQYRLEIHVGAANLRPVVTCIEIEHSGDWFPDEPQMFSMGIRIRQVDSPCRGA